MAKGYKVEGKSIQQLMRLRASTVNSMNKEDLRRVVSRLASAANKRARRMEAKGITTPATRQMEKEGGKFSVKGKDVNELRHEYRRVRKFLRNKTSTISGYKKMIARLRDKLAKSRTQEQNRKKRRKSYNAMLPPQQETPPESENAPEIPAYDEDEEPADTEDPRELYDKYDKIFRVIDRLRESNPWMGETRGSAIEAAVESYINSNPDIDVDTAYEKMNQQVKAWYEKEAKRDSKTKWSVKF